MNIHKDEQDFIALVQCAICSIESGREVFRRTQAYEHVSVK